MQTLFSTIDQSVNFVPDSKFESRFVHRGLDYFIAYLSSHNGCNKACRFCHLTQTKQTNFTHATIENYLEQIRPILAHYASQVKSGMAPVSKINFNFMARGEPFANDTILNNSAGLIDALSEQSSSHNLTPKFNFSTIGPTELGGRLISDIISPTPENHIYYSLYSVNEHFRKKWLPKTLPVNSMLENMRDFQNKGGTNVLHWALIKGENDSMQDIHNILERIEHFGIKAKFNLVRYNPYSPAQGTEPDDATIQQYFNTISSRLQESGSKIVSRVGFDVKASCGMFVA